MASSSGCGVYGAAHTFFRRLPPSWRTGLKSILGSQGHGRSRLDWLTARKDATGKKRLDDALERVIRTVGTETARQITGKVCIDFGSGYVPTDGVVLWLLGASEVHGFDYNNIAKPRQIAKAIMTADTGRIQRQLQTLQLDTDWSDRLDALMRWSQGDSHEFPAGYSYIAPADVITSPMLMPTFDVLVSTSVLEHVAPSLMVPLLDALKSRENARATQIHCVDLRDHRDFDNAPYGFLDPTRHFDAEAESDSRGNGMTLRDWESLLCNHPEWGLKVCSHQDGRPHLMPAAIPVSSSRIVADSLVLRSVTAEPIPRTEGS